MLEARERYRDRALHRGSHFLFASDSCDASNSSVVKRQCDDWAGGESTETRGRCNGELDDADEDNKEDS